MNIAIYLRKSRQDDETESVAETLSRHKKTLLAFAKTNNLIITNIYEEVVSGDSLFVRPEMIKLLSDIENDLYDGVLCMDIDRLGRVDTKDRGIILDTFKTHNTKIITPRKIYDLNNDIDEFSTEIEMLLARQELKKITQRMQSGIKRTVEDGYHVGEPPYGYRRIYVNKRPTLEICEDEANIIHMVFDMYVNQGYGSQTIAAKLNSMGYSPRKNSKFSRTTIQFYLQNEIYIGKIIWNKRKHLKKKFPTDKNKSVLNPVEDWIVSDGVHPPIIDEDIFYKAQKIRQSHSHPPSFNGTIQNPLAGLVHCSKCGEIMTRQTSKKTPPRLICNTVNCMKSTIIEKAEKIVLNSLHETAERWQAILDNKQSDITPQIMQLTSQISSAKRQLAKLNGQNDTLHDFLEQGVYTIDTFLSRSKILQNKIETLEKEIAEYQKELNDINKKPKLREILPTLRYLLDNYDNMPPSEQNRLYKQIIKRIDYTHKKEPNSPITLDITYNDWV